MTSAARKILQEALALSEHDRQSVAESLLDSIPRDTAEEIERRWNEEAVRRARAVELGQSQPLDGATAVQELESKLRDRHGE